MSQSQVWKKRPAGMANELRDQAKCWLEPVKLSRKLMTTVNGDMWKAGLKRKRF